MRARAGGILALALSTVLGSGADGTLEAQAPGPAQEVWMFGAPRTLTLNSANARVSVRGWDRDSVRIEAWEMGAVRLEPQSTSGILQLREQRRLRDQGHAVRYAISLPAGSDLRITLTVGDVDVEGIEGLVNVGVAEGEAVGTRLRGSIRFSAVRGGVRLADVRGTIEARSVEGDVVLEGVGGRVEARSTSGDVRIRTEGPTIVDAESYSGELHFSGVFDPGEPSTLATHSGAVTLRLDPSTGPTIFAGSVQGSSRADCPSAPSILEDDTPLVIGSGDGAQVEVVSFSGGIEVVCTGSSPR